MCKTTEANATATKGATANVVTRKESRTRLLLSLESCSSDDQHNPVPNPSVIYSGAVILGGLIASELFFRYLFEQIKDYHPVLQPLINRQILARHIGVDTLSLAFLALMGWQARSVIWCVVDAWWHGKTGAVAPAGYMNRLYTVHPAAIRIAVFFFWYQIKNTYDTIVWNDGPEYIFHHIFSLLTSWVAIGPFFCHFYAVFYLALCEISTAVLCLLANFDDKQGVPGLGDAFPTAKVAVGGVFVTLFIFCRCIAWPIFAYYFFNDVSQALKTDDARSTASRKVWMQFLRVSLTGLSILQIAWLGQIFIIAKEELVKSGFM